MTTASIVITTLIDICAIKYNKKLTFFTMQSCVFNDCSFKMAQEFYNQSSGSMFVPSQLLPVLAGMNPGSHLSTTVALNPLRPGILT